MPRCASQLDGVAAGLAAGRPDVEPRFGMIDGQPGRLQGGHEHGPAPLVSLALLAFVIVVVECGDHRCLHRRRHHHPRVLAHRQQLGDHRRIAGDEPGAVARPATTSSTASGWPTARCGRRRRPTDAAPRSGRRPSPARGSTRRRRRAHLGRAPSRRPCAGGRRPAPCRWDCSASSDTPARATAGPAASVNPHARTVRPANRAPTS